MIAIPSFFIFLVYSLAIGGDALNGYVEGDKYFVSSHGTNTEVSEFIFNVSWYLGFTMMSTFIPMIVFGSLSNWLFKPFEKEQND